MKHKTKQQWLEELTVGKYCRLTEADMKLGDSCNVCGNPWKYITTGNCIYCNRIRKRGAPRVKRETTIRNDPEPNMMLAAMLARKW